MPRARPRDQQPGKGKERPATKSTSSFGTPQMFGALIIALQAVYFMASSGAFESGTTFKRMPRSTGKVARYKPRPGEMYKQGLSDERLPLMLPEHTDMVSIPDMWPPYNTTITDLDSNWQLRVNYMANLILLGYDDPGCYHKYENGDEVCAAQSLVFFVTPVHGSTGESGIMEPGMVSE